MPAGRDTGWLILIRMTNFPCTACGMCCRKVGVATSAARKMVEDGEKDPYVLEVASFPYGVTAEGACENLLPDNKCAIYATRPDICSVDKTWEKHHSANISLSTYYLSTAMLCNQLITDGGAGNNFFIDTQKLLDESVMQ